MTGPYRPLFVDAEADIAKERENERILERQLALLAQLESLCHLHAWPRLSYIDRSDIEARIGAYMKLGAGLRNAHGLTLGLTDLIR